MAELAILDAAETTVAEQFFEASVSVNFEEDRGSLMATAWGHGLTWA